MAARQQDLGIHDDTEAGGSEPLAEVKGRRQTSACLPTLDRAERMVRTQLEGRDIHDRRVKDAMSRLPRDRFIPGGGGEEAFGDHPVPIGRGQTISQPYMVAVMTQELRLAGGERVLEIGTGSGYQTAVLAALCSEVYTVERIGSLLGRARALLEELSYHNIRFLHADGTVGWPEYSPYDRIVVTAAARRIPDELLGQLVDGGILVAPVGEAEMYQRLATVRRVDRHFETSYGLGCRFVPLLVGSD